MQSTRVSLPMVLLAWLAWHLSPSARRNKPAHTQSLTLHDAVRLALSPGGNLSIDVADQSVAAAQARYQESRAAIKPSVDFSFNAMSQRLSLDAFGFQSIHVPGFTFPSAVGPFAVLESRVHIRQNLFDLESLRRKEAASARVVAAQTETDEVRDQIAGRVARLYLQAQRDASAVETARALIVTAESTLKETGNRNTEGQALGVDVSEARIEVAAAKQDLLRAQLVRARTEIELLNAMNMDLNTPLQLTDPLTFAAQDIPPPDQAVATALQSRGEILTLQKKLQATRLRNRQLQPAKTSNQVWAWIMLLSRMVN